MHKLIFTAIVTSALGLGVLGGSQAQAGSFGIREQSAIGQGLDFAGVAAGSAGIGSMFWNPATITSAPGWQIQGNASVIFPRAEATPLQGTSPVFLGAGRGSTGDIDSNGVVPSLFLSHQINDRWWFGLGLNSGFGGLTQPPSNYFGQMFARSTSVRSYDVNPNVAFKVTDWLSLGFGAQATLLEVKLDQAMSPAPDAPGATLKTKSWGAGYTAGATLTPRNGTEIGVGYRSSVYEALPGTITVDGMPSLPATSSLHLPDQLTVGLRQLVTPDLTANVGYEWTRWSRLGVVAVRSGLGNSALPFDYRDGSAVNAGGEYRLNDRFTLRAGAGYEWSPVTTANRNVQLLDSDRVSVSAGIGYKFSESLTFDAAYSHYFMVGDHHVVVQPGDPRSGGLPLVAAFSADIDVATVGISYHW